MSNAGDSNSQVIDVGYRFSREHHFDEEQVKAFARMAGDDNPVHHDLEKAHEAQFPELIASGTHTTSLLMGLTASHFSERGRVLGMNFSVDLLRPVLATEKVTLEWVVTSRTQHLKGGWVLELEGNVRAQDDRPRLLGHGRVLFTPF